MAKPTNGPNHGSQVSEYVHFLQEQRETEGGHRGIGREVSEFASGGKAGGNNGGEDTDNRLPDADAGQILIVRDGEVVLENGEIPEYDTIQAAIEAAEEGDTLVIGAGTYVEAITIDKKLDIVGEEGAIIDGSTLSAEQTVLLEDGFSGGSITNLQVIATDDGNAVLTAIGQDVNDVTLSDNTFDAGDNMLGSVVYLNPDASDFTFEGNTFLGEDLSGSPLLGIEADDVSVTGNTFGDTEGSYATVEIFDGNDGTTTDVVLLGNVGLDASEIHYG